MEGPATGKYKMKGHTLPGINQRLDDHPKNVAEQGLSGSSAFQYKSALKHKPWAEEHLEKPAHSGSKEAHEAKK